MPFISICIPAYKNTEYLSRLLDSIAIQDFKNFEVIITDDSPDNALNDLVKQYASKFQINYIKNNPALGSPLNWNAAILNAHGEWIKIMHDDDWFTSKTSLSSFAEVGKSTNIDFVFSGYYEVDIQLKKRHCSIISNHEEALIRKSSFNLLKKNFIGHPSTTLIRNNKKKWFDPNLKWVVDIEFYIRILRTNKKFCVIKKPLITIGINPLQITKKVFRDPTVEIPENLLLLELNPALLKNFYAYDYYWRLFRNLSLRSLNDLQNYNSNASIPSALKNMLFFQRKFPLKALRNGFISKILMTISYVKNKKK